MSPEEKKATGRWFRPRTLVIILVLLIVALAGTYGLIRYLALAADREAGHNPGPMQQMEPFYVNLAEERGRGYLKVVMVLELEHGRVEGDIERFRPVLRDEVIALLRGKKVAELQEEDQYAELKREITQRLNNVLPDGGIDAVYFTEFLISH